MDVDLFALTPADLERIARTEGGPAWKSDPAVWAHRLDDQNDGRRKILVARSGEAVFAYGHLDLRPPYPPFADRGIPAICDLVVAENTRRKGLATRLIAAFEDMARERACPAIGIGVGLYAAYGPAQRLYVKLGYMPNGRGITHGDDPVVPGRTYRVDDDLVLWLTKPL